MGKKPRTKMPREQRAKQFAPFQAVGGLEEALRRAEAEHRRMLETGNVVNVPVEDTYSVGTTDNTEGTEG